MSNETLSIDDLGLAPRILGPLKKAGIHTVGEIKGMGDLELLDVEGIGPGSLKTLRLVVDSAMAPSEPAPEPSPSFTQPAKSKPATHATLKESRQAEAIERLQESALKTQQTLKLRESQFRLICDDLLLAGNTPDAMRTYWPEYLSPEERGE